MVPKIGPSKVLELRTPTPGTEPMFEASFNASLDRYRRLLEKEDAQQLTLTNDNFDTGEVTGPGIFRLNDETRAKLLDTLAKQNFRGTSPGLRAELLKFHAHPDAPDATERKPKEWVRVQAQLEQLKTAAPLAISGDVHDASQK